MQNKIFIKERFKERKKDVRWDKWRERKMRKIKK